MIFAKDSDVFVNTLVAIVFEITDILVQPPIRFNFKQYVCIIIMQTWAPRSQHKQRTVCIMVVYTSHFKASLHSLGTYSISRCCFTTIGIPIIQMGGPHDFIMEHDDVIKWKHFPRYWPFVRGIHRSRVNSPHKGQWRAALMFPICVWIYSWVNNREAGDLRRHHAHYDVIVMESADWDFFY